MPKFSEINKLTREGHYQVNQDWEGIQDVLARYTKQGLDLDPDFQRGHVWTTEQKTAYIEFKLRGGHGSNEIRFNCVGWQQGLRGDFVLVDGKQRLQAVLDFLDNKIPAFGHFRNEYEDQHFIRSIDFIFKVNDLKNREDVLNWYLDINTGGTPHSSLEINKVRELLSAEREKNESSKIAASCAGMAAQPRKPKP